MIRAFALLAVLAAVAPTAARAADSRPGDRVLAALQTQSRVAVVRHTRARSREHALERTFAVDTLAADASWLMRFERMTAELPSMPARTLRLVPGQTYAFLWRVGSLDVAGAPDAWVDFRGPWVLLRDGADSTARSLRGRETDMVRMLRQLDTGDPAVRQLAAIYGVGDAMPGEQLPSSAEPAPASSAETPAAAPRASADSLAAPPGELAPEVLTRVPPVYPAKAKRDRLQGRVLLKVFVDEKGRASEVRVVRSVPDLDNAAIAAVAKWTFRPAKKDGTPIAAWVVVPVEFRLR